MTAPRTGEGVERNERLALLLGWKYRADDFGDERWFDAKGVARYPGYQPRFDRWFLFPELQEYARGLDTAQMSDIEARIIRVLQMDGRGSYADDFGMWTITPTILGNAILEVCGEGE